MDSDSKKTKVELIIGISGHRWLKETPELLHAIDQVLGKITHVYSLDKFKLLSPLAEGADRIVAKRILSLSNTHLIALLPFPVEEYLEDFSTPESVKEFQELLHRADQIIELPGAQVREDAYVALERALLDQCDIFVAIWDGEPARGRGGTAEIVREARTRGMPLAWILHKQPESSRSEMSPSEEGQIEVFFEHFP